MIKLNKSLKLVIYLLLFIFIFFAKFNEKIKVNGLSDLVYVVDRGMLDNTFSFENINSTTCTSELSNYFYNLNNVPENINGTCGYIAVGMALTYFDSYYTNSLVNDSFIIKSISNNQSIFEIQSPTFNDNFHQFLVNLGYSHGFQNSIYPNEQQDLIANYINCFSLNNRFTLSYVEIDNDYYINAETIPHFTESTLTNSQTLINQVIAYIQLGIPVITSFLGFSDISYNGIYRVGHVAIAYDYYTKSNGQLDLIYHMGYSNDSHCKILSEYALVGYTVLLPSSYANHICSNNYLIDGVPTCPCTFINHEHKYISYNSLNKISHMKQCYCGYSIHEAHTLSHKLNYDYCTKCDYIISNSGNIPINNYNGGEEHDE